MTFFLTVEDFVRASIGPFVSEAAAMAHYEWSKTRGDSGALIGITAEPDPAADITMTEAEDLAYDPN